MDLSMIAMGLAVVGTSLLSAALAMLALPWLARPRRVTWTPFDAVGNTVAFLFEDEVLVDATPEAQALLAQGPEQMEDWPRLAAVLRERFPGLTDRLSRLGEEQWLELAAPDGRMRLVAEWRDGLTRIDVAPSEDTTTGRDPVATAALLDEVGDLRATLDAVPMPIWKQDAGGAVRWANSAYIELALRRDQDCDTLTWPLPRLFEKRELVGDETGPEGAGRALNRITLTVPAQAEEAPDETLWFDLHSEQTSDATLFCAVPSDELVRVEQNLEEFIQTLSKTFAHLPTGIAVFDRNRRLALFNPALTDLSNLQPLFLSRRPSLFEFLDQLREAQRMPEPKDYREWRRKISEMEAAAAHGTHIETWPLPNGQTYRVTGRPHPDGAVAFLFQDITSEISLTRRFRSELELGQAVVDSLDEAIVVFSPSGSLVMSNAAYDRLWATSDALEDGSTEEGAEMGLSMFEDTLRPNTIQDAVAVWQAACQPCAAWPDFLKIAENGSPRQGWMADMRLVDGRALACRVVPLTGSATLIGFRPQTPQAGIPVKKVAPGDAASAAGA